MIRDYSLTDKSYLKIPQYYYIITTFKRFNGLEDLEFYSTYHEIIIKSPYKVISIKGVHIIPTDMSFVSERDMNDYTVELINLQEFTTKPYRRQCEISKEEWNRYMQERDKNNELEGQFMQNMFGN